MKTILDKKTLRYEAQNMRNSIDFSLKKDKISLNILQKILNSFSFKNANNIALYMPIKNEIDITGLLNFKYKNFYLPRCTVNNELEFCLYKKGDKLKENKWKIKEPLTPAINPDILDIIYIPALMANEKCYRLGYGKGFYDRFFGKYNPKAKKIIILSKCFINNNFIQDENDVQCDEIICE